MSQKHDIRQQKRKWENCMEKWKQNFKNSKKVLQMAIYFLKMKSAFWNNNASSCNLDGIILEPVKTNWVLYLGQVLEKFVWKKSSPPFLAEKSHRRRYFLRESSSSPMRFHTFSEDNSIDLSFNYLLTKFKEKIMIWSEMVTRNVKRTYDFLEGLYYREGV